MESRPEVPQRFRTAAAAYLSQFSAKSRDEMSKGEVALLREAGRSSANNAGQYFMLGFAIPFALTKSLLPKSLRMAGLFRVSAGSLGAACASIYAMGKSTNYYLTEFLVAPEENCGHMTNTLRKEFFKMVPPNEKYRNYIESTLRDKGMGDLLEKLRFDKDDTFKVEVEDRVLKERDEREREEAKAAVETKGLKRVEEDSSPPIDYSEDYQVRQRQLRFKAVRDEEMKKMGKTSMEEKMSPEELEKLEMSIVERLAKEKNSPQPENGERSLENHNSVTSTTGTGEDFFSAVGLGSGETAEAKTEASRTSAESESNFYRSNKENTFGDASNDWEMYSKQYEKPKKRTTWEELRAKARESKSAFHSHQ